ncbi:MAG: hypothetical protein K1060chlam3_00026 [Candidatus Anoxychlamydiales bacterium]|nr:hypothetical protein [Candidatus Anoxychlamydiales bacterium]
MMNDYYVPPEDFKTPPAIYVTLEEVQKPMDIKPLLVEKSNKPTDEEYKKAAISIKEIFEDGFQWRDLASLMKLSLEYVNNFFTMDGLDKKEAVLNIIDFVIDETDTPYLPDCITDPIFKALASSFVNIIMPDSIDTIAPNKTIESEITLDDIEEFISDIKESFKDGFQLRDIASITIETIKFTSEFINTTADEKKQITKDIVNELIESIEISFIPENFSDSILKALADGFIDASIDTLEEIFISK